MLPLALLFALLIGVSLGLLGGGGSILTVPILRYVLGMEGHTAIATSLLVVGTTSLAGLLVHARRGRVQWRTGLVFGAAGMLGAYLAGRIAHLVPAALLLVGFSVMMFSAALALLRPERKLRAPGLDRRARPPSLLPVPKILVQGLAVGAVAGLVGAGGGFLVVPALVLLGRLPMATAIGTSLLVISLQSFAGFAGYLGHTAIDLRAGLSVSAAAVAGSFGAALLVSRLSAQTLRHGFGWFVIAMAFFILAREAPPLLGLAPHLGIAALVSLVGTAVVAVLRVLSGARRARRYPGARPAPRDEHPQIQAAERAAQ
jgi:uncharacterized membrane protein YfcA